MVCLFNFEEAAVMREYRTSEEKEVGIGQGEREKEREGGEDGGKGKERW